MLGDHPVRMGNGVRSVLEKKGHEYLFQNVAHIFRGSDIVIGNLEVIHSDVGREERRLESEEFRGMPCSIPYLKLLGFSVLGVANNHCMEHGAEAFDDTVAMLRQNGIFPSGVKSDDGTCIPFEVEKDGVRLTLLSYSMRPENYYKGAVRYTLSNERKILDEVERCRSKTDILIVALHWGEEYMDYPSPRQVRFAHRLVNAGVHLILGHHPHVLQGIEHYGGGVIAYSLGNFVFDMWQSETRNTIILKANFLQKSVANIEIIPAFINQDYQPILLSGAALEDFQKRFARLCEKIANKYVQVNSDEMADDALADAENEYRILARQKNLRHRLEDYAYFLLSLYKYQPWVLAQSLKRFCQRRISS